MVDADVVAAVAIAPLALVLVEVDAKAVGTNDCAVASNLRVLVGEANSSATAS